MPKKSNKEEFISKARVVHGDKYDYSKVEYVNSATKVCIICPIHGEFYQTPNAHLMKHGCPKCKFEKLSKTFIKDKDCFVSQANIVHSNRYDYSKVEYKGADKKVEIICKEHGSFWQKPKHHLNGAGCPVCAGCARLSTENFIKISNKVHNYKYDYSKTKYINAKTNVCIICPDHGEFWQKPITHTKGGGCPHCKVSRGEKNILNFLMNNNIEYECQKSIDVDFKLFSRNKLKVDFYLPKHNIIIEFNGIQHYQFIPFFHRDDDAFARQVDRDKRLKEYCKKKGIKLIVIKYNQIDKIDKKLKFLLK